MSDLNELADRVEALDRPDREVDRLLFARFRPEDFADEDEVKTYADPDYKGNNADWYYLRLLGMPRYTASLDAAKAMVPEGCAWDVYGGTRPKQAASVWLLGAWSVEAAAATPALALVAASLRAIARKEQS